MIPDLDTMTAAELETFCRKAREKPKVTLVGGLEGRRVGRTISAAFVDSIFPFYIRQHRYAAWLLWQYAESRWRMLSVKKADHRSIFARRADTYYQELPPYARFRESLDVLGMVKPGYVFRPEPTRGGNRFYRRKSGLTA